jgi:hypothetical protein
VTAQQVLLPDLQCLARKRLLLVVDSDNAGAFRALLERPLTHAPLLLLATRKLQRGAAPGEEVRIHCTTAACLLLLLPLPPLLLSCMEGKARPQRRMLCVGTKYFCWHQLLVTVRGVQRQRMLSRLPLHSLALALTRIACRCPIRSSCSRCS